MKLKYGILSFILLLGIFLVRPIEVEAGARNASAITGSGGAGKTNSVIGWGIRVVQINNKNVFDEKGADTGDVDNDLYWATLGGSAYNFQKGKREITYNHKTKVEATDLGVVIDLSNTLSSSQKQHAKLVAHTGGGGIAYSEIPVYGKTDYVYQRVKDGKISKKKKSGYVKRNAPTALLFNNTASGFKEFFETIGSKTTVDGQSVKSLMLYASKYTNKRTKAYMHKDQVYKISGGWDKKLKKFDEKVNAKYMSAKMDDDYGYIIEYLIKPSFLCTKILNIAKKDDTAFAWANWHENYTFYTSEGRKRFAKAYCKLAGLDSITSKKVQDDWSKPDNPEKDSSGNYYSKYINDKDDYGMKHITDGARIYIELVAYYKDSTGVYMMSYPTAARLRTYNFDRSKAKISIASEKHHKLNSKKNHDHPAYPDYLWASSAKKDFTHFYLKSHLKVKIQNNYTNRELSVDSGDHHGSAIRSHVVGDDGAALMRRVSTSKVSKILKYNKDYYSKSGHVVGKEMIKSGITAVAGPKQSTLITTFGSTMIFQSTPNEGIAILQKTAIRGNTSKYRYFRPTDLFGVKQLTAFCATGGNRYGGYFTGGALAAIKEDEPELEAPRHLAMNVALKLESKEDVKDETKNKSVNVSFVSSGIAYTASDNNNTRQDFVDKKAMYDTPIENTMFALSYDKSYTNGTEGIPLVVRLLGRFDKAYGDSDSSWKIANDERTSRKSLSSIGKLLWDNNNTSTGSSALNDYTKKYQDTWNDRISKKTAKKNGEFWGSADKSDYKFPVTDDNELEGNLESWVSYSNADSNIYKRFLNYSGNFYDELHPQIGYWVGTTKTNAGSTSYVGYQPVANRVKNWLVNKSTLGYRGYELSNSSNPDGVASSSIQFGYSYHPQLNINSKNYDLRVTSDIDSLVKEVISPQINPKGKGSLDVEKYDSGNSKIYYGTSVSAGKMRGDWIGLSLLSKANNLSMVANTYRLSDYKNGDDDDPFLLDVDDEETPTYKEGKEEKRYKDLTGTQGGINKGVSPSFRITSKKKKKVISYGTNEDSPASFRMGIAFEVYANMPKVRSYYTSVTLEYSEDLMDIPSFLSPLDSRYVDNAGSWRSTDATRHGVKGSSITYTNMFAKEVIGLTNHDVKSNFSFYATGTEEWNNSTKSYDMTEYQIDSMQDMPIFTRNAKADKTVKCYVFGISNASNNLDTTYAYTSSSSSSNAEKPWLAKKGFSGSLTTTNKDVGGIYSNLSLYQDFYNKLNGDIPAKDDFKNYMLKLLGKGHTGQGFSNKEYFCQEITNDTVAQVGSFVDNEANPTRFEGCTLYVLKVVVPKTVRAESVVNLQDYQLNHWYPQTFFTENYTSKGGSVHLSVTKYKPKNTSGTSGKTSGGDKTEVKFISTNRDYLFINPDSSASGYKNMLSAIVSSGITSKAQFPVLVGGIKTVTTKINGINVTTQVLKPGGRPQSKPYYEAKKVTYVEKNASADVAQQAGMLKAPVVNSNLSYTVVIPVQKAQFRYTEVVPSSSDGFGSFGKIPEYKGSASVANNMQYNLKISNFVLSGWVRDNLRNYQGFGYGVRYLVYPGIEQMEHYNDRTKGVAGSISKYGGTNPSSNINDRNVGKYINNYYYAFNLQRNNFGDYRTISGISNKSNSVGTLYTTSGLGNYYGLGYKKTKNEAEPATVSNGTQKIEETPESTKPEHKFDFVNDNWYFDGDGSNISDGTTTTIYHYCYCGEPESLDATLRKVEKEEEVESTDASGSAITEKVTSIVYEGTVDGKVFNCYPLGDVTDKNSWSYKLNGGDDHIIDPEYHSNEGDMTIPTVEDESETISVSGDASLGDARDSNDEVIGISPIGSLHPYAKSSGKETINLAGSTSKTYDNYDVEKENPNNGSIKNANGDTVLDGRLRNSLAYVHYELNDTIFYCTRWADDLAQADYSKAGESFTDEHRTEPYSIVANLLHYKLATNPTQDKSFNYYSITDGSTSRLLNIQMANSFKKPTKGKNPEVLSTGDTNSFSGKFPVYGVYNEMFEKIYKYNTGTDIIGINNRHYTDDDADHVAYYSNKKYKSENGSTVVDTENPWKMKNNNTLIGFNSRIATFSSGVKGEFSSLSSIYGKNAYGIENLVTDTSSPTKSEITHNPNGKDNPIIYRLAVVNPNSGVYHTENTAGKMSAYTSGIIKFRPEVAMQYALPKYATSAALTGQLQPTVDSHSGAPSASNRLLASYSINKIYTMGECIRKVKASALYLVTMTNSSGTNDVVTGTVYSDTIGTDANSYESVNGSNLPVIYGGSDITLKVDASHLKLKAVGYALDTLGVDSDATSTAPITSSNVIDKTKTASFSKDNNRLISTFESATAYNQLKRSINGQVTTLSSDTGVYSNTNSYWSNGTIKSGIFQKFNSYEDVIKATALTNLGAYVPKTVGGVTQGRLSDSIDTRASWGNDTGMTSVGSASKLNFEDFASKVTGSLAADITLQVRNRNGGNKLYTNFNTSVAKINTKVAPTSEVAFQLEIVEGKIVCSDDAIVDVFNKYLRKPDAITTKKDVKFTGIGFTSFLDSLATDYGYLKYSDSSKFKTSSVYDDILYKARTKAFDLFLTSDIGQSILRSIESNDGLYGGRAANAYYVQNAGSLFLKPFNNSRSGRTQNNLFYSDNASDAHADITSAGSNAMYGIGSGDNEDVIRANTSTLWGTNGGKALIEQYNTDNKMIDRNNSKTTRHVSANEDKNWYDEVVRTLVIRRYSTIATSMNNITLVDKIDYDNAVDKNVGTAGGNVNSSYENSRARWYISFYFNKAIPFSDERNLYLEGDSTKGTNVIWGSNTTRCRKYSTRGNVLVDSVYIKGADFAIPDEATDELNRN